MSSLPFTCYLAAMHGNVSDAVVKGLLVGLFMAISVGPTLFAVIKYSLNLGHKAAWAFILGVSASDIMYVTIANVAAAWLRYLEPYEKYIAIGGSIVLMIMGISTFLKKHKPKHGGTPEIISGGHYFKIWLSGFLVNTLNPGALITWLGAVTLIASKPAFYRFILFGTCLVIILGIDFSKVYLADKIKGFLTVKRIIMVQRFSAVCLFLIGSVILGTTLVNMQSKTPNKKSEVDKILSK